jgi:hypothetical protein
MNPFNVDSAIIPFIPVVPWIILLLVLLGGIWAFVRMAESLLEGESTESFIDIAKRFSIFTEPIFFSCLFAQIFLGIWCWYRQMPPLGLYPHPLTPITLALCPIMLFCGYWVIVSLCKSPAKETH